MAEIKKKAFENQWGIFLFEAFGPDIQSNEGLSAFPQSLTQST
jgi:hypothetical protein